MYIKKILICYKWTLIYNLQRNFDFAWKEQLICTTNEKSFATDQHCYKWTLSATEDIMLQYRFDMQCQNKLCTCAIKCHWVATREYADNYKRWCATNEY